MAAPSRSTAPTARSPSSSSRVRFALAVLAAGATATPAFFRLADWIGTTAYLALGYLTLVGLGAGFFAGRRSALAGALAVYAGLLLWVLLTLLGGSRGAGVFDAVAAVGTLALVVVPHAVAAAAAGALGGWLRARVVAKAAR
jgi:hypothetical protein